MIVPQQIFDPFDSFDADTWNRSDFAVSATWNQTAWEADYVEEGDGVLRLKLDGTDKDTKPFTGAELQSEELFTYGSFEMRLQTSGETGTVSAFFLYTGEFFGASEQNEIDFEFLGNNPSQVSINYYYGDDKFANYSEEDIELGFDTSADFHDYRIDWTPDAIRWFADDRLFYEIRAEDAPLPIPDKDMLVYSSLWTGDANLEGWHGPVDQDIDTSMSLDSFSYTPALLSLPVDQTGAVTLRRDLGGACHRHGGGNLFPSGEGSGDRRLSHGRICGHQRPYHGPPTRSTGIVSICSSRSCRPAAGSIMSGFWKTVPMG